MSATWMNAIQDKQDRLANNRNQNVNVVAVVGVKLLHDWPGYNFFNKAGIQVP